MRWTIHGERDLYRDQWVHVVSADVQLPDGRHLDHRIVRTHANGAGLVLVRDRHVLLIWRHRFIPDTLGWEIPCGGINPGETAPDAAVRETEEETGWRAQGPIRFLLSTHPSPGLVQSEHHIFRADDAAYLGPPEDSHESDRVEWVPLRKSAPSSPSTPSVREQR